ncbi:MAG: hypothetical protein JSW58_08450 [Candidatus Latescibacterota bacterium]|nr:MAG: hypothetical protein JSW58_08450 [Candidatus Latescibacterota bacterium]
MAREFSIVRELSRRELERHTKRFIGVTVTKPDFRDQNGLTEWVCDIRVGVKEGWALVKNCLIAQWAIGAVTDMNVPVLAERSEAGRVTIIARSDIQLPDIDFVSYSYDQLEFSFMHNLRTLDDGSVVDGFGYEFAGPSDGGYTAPVGTSTTHRYSNRLIEWGSTDFDYGVTEFGATISEWEEV